MASDCPVNNTCPDINLVIDGIRSSLQTTAGVKDKLSKIDTDLMNPIEWKDLLDEIIDESNNIEGYLYGLEYTMDDLRDANSSLRDWGYDLKSEVEELRAEIESLSV